MGRIARVWENRIFEGKPPKNKRKSPENHWFSGLGGGDKRDRTADLLNAIQALSRLDRLHTPLNRANERSIRGTPHQKADKSFGFILEIDYNRGQTAYQY